MLWRGFIWFENLDLFTICLSLTFPVKSSETKVMVSDGAGHQQFKGELKSKTIFSEMALKITLSSILTAEIFNHF